MSAENINIIELVKTVRTFSEAIKVAIRLWRRPVNGNKEQTEKQIYLELGIDKGHWARCLAGKAHFPVDLIAEFCEIVENDFLLHWLGYQRGYELRVIPKILEEQLVEKDKKIEELEKENKLMRSLIQEKVGASN